MKLELVSLEKYLKEIIAREEIRSTYLGSYNSLGKKIERIRFTSVLGDRKRDSEELAQFHDRIIDSYLLSLKEALCSYTGFKVEELEDPPYEFRFVDPEEFDDSLKGQTNLLIAYLHVFITALKKGFADGSILDSIKAQYQEVQQIVGDDVNENGLTFDDLQLLILESVKSHNAYIRSQVLQRILTQIGNKNYEDNLKLSPLSEVEKKYSVQVPSLIREIAKNITKKKASSYQPKTIEIYLNQYRLDPQMSRPDRIEKCISIAKDETVRKEFIERCADNTLSGWEDKLENRLKELKRFSGLTS
ncbi:hypothetical protein [Fodinibius sp. SL11]|uniref:hypothetical protein n=1 Tax=Fodinibius sp. SL11 TaxID=3425690 RepID=UPI003F881A62